MSKKSFIGKSLAVIGAVAAVGGVCYVFRDKIKESKIYNDLDMDDKLNKVKSFVNNHVSSDDYDDDDFFFDEDEDTSDFSSTANRGYVALNTDADTTTADSDSTPSLENTTKNSEPEITAEDVVEEKSIVEPETKTEAEPEITAEDVVEEKSIIEPEQEKSVPDNFGGIPTISFDDMTEIKTDEPEGYEYQGLSDVSEDPDVLEDQDKLDF